MIAYVSGRLAALGADHAILDVGGVGLRVGASARTLAGLGAVGGAATLVTEMLVREDAISLVGFADAAEHGWFGALRDIQGVGAKVALAVLSALSPAELSRACALKDAAMVARANGVGPKLAARIVNELHARVPALGVGVAAPGVAAALDAPRTLDAVAALTGLGFRSAEASRAVADAEAELGDGAALEAIIRLALRRVSG